jgi:hypothetical protein
MTTFMLPLSLWWLLSILLIVKGNSIVEVKEILTIAGNFSLNGKFTNLAHYDIITGVWSSSNEPDLYVYGESNGNYTLYKAVSQKRRLFVLLIYVVSPRCVVGHEGESLLAHWPQWQLCGRIICCWSI